MKTKEWCLAALSQAWPGSFRSAHNGCLKGQTGAFAGATIGSYDTPVYRWLDETCLIR